MNYQDPPTEDLADLAEQWRAREEHLATERRKLKGHRR